MKTMKWIRWGFVLMGALGGCAERVPVNLPCASIDPSAFPLRAPHRDELWVTTTDYTVGRLEVFKNLSGNHPEPKFASVAIHSDAIVRRHPTRGLAVVVNRRGADNLQIIDERTGETVSQCSVGKGVELRDVAFAPDDTLFLSRYATSELWRVDFGLRHVFARIDLAKAEGFANLADADGLPEMSTMRIVGNRLYVTLQRLDSKRRYAPTDFSLIAIIDIEQNRFLKAVKLAATNPNLEADLEVRGDSLYVMENGVLGGRPPSLDGQIERLKLPDLSEARTVVGEANLGGDLMAFAWLDDHRGAAIVTNPDTVLTFFDGSAGGRVTKSIAPGGYTFGALRFDRDRERLYVSDMTRPGIRVFNTRSLVELPEERIDLLLPPYQFLIDP